MRARSLPWLLVLASLALTLVPWVAKANDPFLVVPPADVVDRAPAYRYVNMGEQQVLEELDRRKILYQRVEPHGAVQTPIRLTGRLHGVHIHSALPEHERPTTPFEICDARFALALDDFAEQLARRGIVELIHYTMYRPSVAPAVAASSAAWTGSAAKLGPPEQWAAANAKNAAKPADRAKKSTTRTTRATRRGKKPNKPAAPPPPPPRLNTSPSRHPLGLAIDPGAFVKQDGSVLSVASHFRGRIGAQTCGQGASPPSDPRARELWDIVCDAFDAKIFTYVLTPNFDQPHQDHFHMEINPGVRWFLYH
jgi:hypothetical protein